MFYYHATMFIMAFNILFEEVFLCSLFCSSPQYAPCCTCTNGKIGQLLPALVLWYSPCHFVSRSQAQLESWRLCLKENFCTRFLSSLSVVVEDMEVEKKHTHIQSCFLSACFVSRKCHLQQIWSSGGLPSFKYWRSQDSASPTLRCRERRTLLK